jgi:hypothetical protein
VERVTLSSEGPGYQALEFHTPVFTSHGFFSCVATLTEDGDQWSVDVEMIEPYRSDMLGFFEEMAVESSGWPGTKEWRSEFATLRVTAVTGGDGNVSLAVTAWWPPDYEETRQLGLSLPAGELKELATKVRVFLDLPHGERFRAVVSEP